MGHSTRHGINRHTRVKSGAAAIAALAERYGWQLFPLERQLVIDKQQ